MRVLWISLGSLFVVFCIVFMTRIWGLSLPISEFQSEFFQGEKPWQGLVVLSLSEAEQALSKNPEVILDLPLRLSEDHVLFVQSPQFFEQSLQEMKWDPKDYRGKKPYEYPFAVLQKQFPGLIPVDEFLKKFPQQRFILNIVDSAMDVHKVVVSTLEKNNVGPLVLIQSDTDVILKAIKEMKPLWTFGTSNAETMRLLTFDSIGVVAATSVRSDIYFSVLKLSHRSVFNSSLYEELRRRKKKIMLGPLESAEEIQEAKSFGVDGYVYMSLTDLPEGKK